MFDVNGDEGSTKATSFARHLYSREQTQQLPAAREPAPEREEDAPVRFVRSEVELTPSAVYPVAIPQPLTPEPHDPEIPLDAGEFHDRACRRELMNRLSTQLDDIRNVEVQVFGDCAVLRGIVSCPLARLLAEDIAYSMPEIWDCHNQLEVDTESDDTSVAA